MPRQSKGPRLYLRKGRTDTRTGQRLPDRWFIRDGAREIGTGCGPERMGDAEAALASYIAEKWSAPQRAGDPAQVLVADALTFYGRGKGQALRTDAATNKGFVKHLLGFWGDKTLADVKRSTCESYVTHRCAQTRRVGKDLVSAQTARRELEHLSAAIGYWDGEHPLSPRPRVSLPAKPESPREALTRSQGASLLWAALGHRKDDEGRWAPTARSTRGNRAHLPRFILIGFYTGTRSGPIKRLSWVESLHAPWVDLDAGVIYRRGRAERESRTKRRPMVKIPNRLLAHMRRWKRLDDAKGLTMVLHHGGEAVGSVRTGFAGCVADSGLPKGVTAHWLRHTAATWLMERGCDLWTAAGYLGMTAQTLEKHYAHARPDHQSAARRAMG